MATTITLVFTCVQVADRMRLNHLTEKQLHTLASEIEQDERSQLKAEARHVESPQHRHTRRPGDWLLSVSESTEPGKEEGMEGERGKSVDPSNTWYRLPQDSPSLSGEVCALV